MLLNNEQLSHDLPARIVEHVRVEELRGARELLSILAPADRAEVVAELPADYRVSMFRTLRMPMTIGKYEYASRNLLHELLGGLGRLRLAEVYAGKRWTLPPGVCTTDW